MNADFPSPKVQKSKTLIAKNFKKCYTLNIAVWFIGVIALLV